MLPQALLVRQVAVPTDVSREAVALQNLPLLHGGPVSSARVFFLRGPDALARATAVGVGTRVDRVANDLEKGRQVRAAPLQVPPVRPVIGTDPQADIVAHQVAEDS